MISIRPLGKDGQYEFYWATISSPGQDDYAGYTVTFQKRNDGMVYQLTASSDRYLAGYLQGLADAGVVGHPVSLEQYEAFGGKIAPETLTVVPNPENCLYVGG